MRRKESIEVILPGQRSFQGEQGETGIKWNGKTIRNNITKKRGGMLIMLKCETFIYSLYSVLDNPSSSPTTSKNRPKSWWQRFKLLNKLSELLVPTCCEYVMLYIPMYSRFILNANSTLSAIRRIRPIGSSFEERFMRIESVPVLVSFDGPSSTYQILSINDDHWSYMLI